jgi:GAF domain-containing protein
VSGESVAFVGVDKATRYAELVPQVRALVDGEPDLIANLANIAAALKECIAAASWVGFYVMRGDELVLGPFQGKVACVRIALGRGVCGTAAAERRALVVPDVELFPGHIACDAGSKSEIVVPIVVGDRVVGVLDVDSYDRAAFDDTDERGLTLVCDVIATLSW